MSIGKSNPSTSRIDNFVLRIVHIRHRHHHREADRQTSHRIGYRRALRDIHDAIDDERLRPDYRKLLRELEGSGE